MIIENVVHLPELCPATRNPKEGSTLCIRYTAGEQLLELFSLDEYIRAFIGDQQVRDMELFVQVVAEDLREVLGHALEIEAELHYRRIQQSQRICIQV